LENAADVLLQCCTAGIEDTRGFWSDTEGSNGVCMVSVEVRGDIHVDGGVFLEYRRNISTSAP